MMTHANRRAFLAGSLGAAATLAAPPLARAVAARTSPHVVELFTSQGCSSCPPADAYLADLAKRDDVLPLAYHVDYWNYLGWQDTFSSPLWSQRQRDYARRMGSGVYTPQMVIDGRYQAVGSRVDEVEAILKRAERPAEMLEVERDRAALRIRMSGGGAGAVLHMVWFDRARSVPISRGENAGATLLYAHVVRGMQMLAMSDGNGVALDLPLADLRATGHEACALIVQQKDGDLPGPILAAHEVGEIAMALPKG